MAYPDVRATEPCEEEIPLDKDGKPRTPCHLVHFDIDPFNGTALSPAPELVILMPPASLRHP